MIKGIHIKQLLPVLFLLIFGTVSSQNLNQKLDSIENTFKETSGLERIELIADFIRNANLYEIDHNRLKPYLEEAFAWEKKHPNKVLLNTLNLGYANILIAEKKSPEAIRCLNKIINSGVSQTRKDSISTYDFLNGLYTNVGAYSEAWKVLQIRDNVIEHIPETNPMYYEYNKWKMKSYPILLFNTKQYEKAIPLFKKQITYANTQEDFHLGAGSLNNLGLSYLKLNKSDSAIWAFNESKLIWKKFLSEISTDRYMRDKLFLDLLDGNIGAAYNQKGAYKKAIPLLLIELETSKNSMDYIGAVGPLTKLSTSYIGLKQYDKALSLLDRASRISEINNYPNGLNLRRIYESKIQALEGIGNVNEALQLYKKLTVLNDSTLQIANNKRLAVLEVVYEVENKDRELINQKNRIVKAEKKAAQQKENQRSLILGATLMLVIIILLTVSLLQRKKRAKRLAVGNKLIEHQKEVIEQALVEKETLLKEIHHRVKNNLQLISGMLELQSSKISDDGINEIIKQGQNRIKSMALIHQQLYESENLGKIDFRKYVKQLTNDITIMINGSNNDIDIVLDIIDFSLDLDTAVPVGLIINELVLNAFKHGFLNKEKGTITIGLEALEDEYYQLTVSDNGAGLPADFDLNNTDSLGLRLVKGLSRQIGGNCEFKNVIGTMVTIKFRNG